MEKRKKWGKEGKGKVASWLFFLGGGHPRANNVIQSTKQPDRAKVAINGLYKVAHGLSIAAKIYDLE